MTKYNSNAVTLRNNKGIHKPNEDYYLADDEKGIYILLDGVSRDKIGGIYPNPSPALEVSKLLAETVYEILAEIPEDSHLEESGFMRLLQAAVERGNDALRVYNAQRKWENDFLPGTVGIVALVKDDMLHYAYIGDCIGMVLNEGKHVFTVCQTEQIAAHKKEFTAFEIRNKICNNAEHPYSYGVLNGDRSAMDFLRCGQIPLEEGDKIFLCSDGFSDVMDRFSRDVLCQMSVEHLAANSSSQDDRTMIRIEKEL